MPRFSSSGVWETVRITSVRIRFASGSFCASRFAKERIRWRSDRDREPQIVQCTVSEAGFVSTRINLVTNDEECSLPVDQASTQARLSSRSGTIADQSTIPALSQHTRAASNLPPLTVC
jgi:hypothetical protein